MKSAKWLRRRFQRVFYCEMGAAFTAAVARNQIDADKYDPVSDHLIVTLTTVFRYWEL